MIITESSMTFGEFKDENVFYIEKSSQYTSRLRPQGVKSCEFILSRDNKLLFIEAKTSNPKKPDSNSSSEQLEKYNDFINDIVIKMRHSINLYASILLKKHSQANISNILLDNDLSNKEIVLILVVKKAKQEWLSDIKDLITDELTSDLRIWGINRILAINEDTAKYFHLVI